MAKGADNFIAEVSMDETDSPQTPPELLELSLLDESLDSLPDESLLSEP